MEPRPYQTKAFDDLRQAFANKHKRVLFQLSTGAGKTVVFSMVTESAAKKGNSVWIVVPRCNLVDQTDEHLTAIGVKHSCITAGRNESRAFKVHVCSKDTLIRRIKADKIKNWPDIIIFDEAHVALDQQIFVGEKAPAETIFIGVTATPEKTDGRGLSEFYQVMVLGPTIRELVETGYLVPINYFNKPKIKGLDDIKRIGTDLNAKELEALFKNKAIYGGIIDNYLELARDKTTLIFCQSVKQSDEVAKQMRMAGHNFESIHGKTAKAKQKELLQAARKQEVNLVTCDLLTYGVDVKAIEHIIMLRRTWSVALFYQIIGRGLRPFENEDTGYIKKYLSIADHVGNFDIHGHPFSDRIWNFEGGKKRKITKAVSSDTLKLCQNCWMYFDGNVCPHCGTMRDIKQKPDMIVVEGRLVKEEPVKLKDRPWEERKEYLDYTAELKANFKNHGFKKDVYIYIIEQFLKIAKKLKNPPMWVYHELNTLKYAVNLPLLQGISEVLDYKSGWVHFQQQNIKLEVEPQTQESQK